MNHSYQKLEANEEYVFNTKDQNAHKFHAQLLPILFD